MTQAGALLGQGGGIRDFVRGIAPDQYVFDGLILPAAPFPVREEGA